MLEAGDKVALFAVAVIISYLSWRYIEQPFRARQFAPSRGATYRFAAASSAVLLAGSAGGVMLSRTQTDTDRAEAALDAYNAYAYQPLYRFGTCFSPASGVFDEACLRIVPGKTNLMLWGDSLAAHYYEGLRNAVDTQAVNIMQATQPACMATLNAQVQGTAACRNFSVQVQAFFARQRPDVVVMSADWLEYARPPRFDRMIADVRNTLEQLEASGIRVVLLGPAVQFRSRLPSMLIRTHLRKLEPRPEDFVLPDVFALDAMMKAALPANRHFNYVSVLDAVCPQRQCPLTVTGVPLSFDHAHLTAEGSDYVMARVLPMLGLPKR
ncbi:SGNH hydrolase domain-containing protein [Bradyrhizobium sp. ARR65]|uniref:SGNH hydrolase domain-containing protein n=1 Tax=Bradyrhizobium sp. ARR65 TaxID=1040989 RepID=UPI000684A1FC|nr:SGNH hydrolase domain-containing protein [Bradyrhizobium sp. ARR65]